MKDGVRGAAEAADVEELEAAQTALGKRRKMCSMQLVPFISELRDSRAFHLCNSAQITPCKSFKVSI